MSRNMLSLRQRVLCSNSVLLGCAVGQFSANNDCSDRHAASNVKFEVRHLLTF